VTNICTYPGRVIALSVSQSVSEHKNESILSKIGMLSAASCKGQVTNNLCFTQQESYEEL